jgi:hypothetical protein
MVPHDVEYSLSNIECLKRCQIECLIEGESECQIVCQHIYEIYALKCHGGDHSKYFFFGIINPKYTNPIYTLTHPDVFSRQALTIAHELLYDDRVLLAFTEQDTTPLKGRETGEKSPGRVEKSYIVVLFFLDDNIRRYII